MLGFLLPVIPLHFSSHVAYGLWLMAYGLWLMAYGLWLMAYGLGLNTNLNPSLLCESLSTKSRTLNFDQ
ncbi:hypothetical protein VAT7223_04446 [Vibrio atlanticus]|uniref:Uncharacterized protein n=1 Tax=Vibrio atlanticus TaxID=693153 RepID=A0A1C3J5H8_9VIBR|nr:hypothetical protein VAT7223_04446 [Vibrio atlanticus]